MGNQTQQPGQNMPGKKDDSQRSDESQRSDPQKRGGHQQQGEQQQKQGRRDPQQGQDPNQQQDRDGRDAERTNRQGGIDQDDVAKKTDR